MGEGPGVRRRYGEADPGEVTKIKVKAPIGKQVNLVIRKAVEGSKGEATFADGRTTMQVAGTGQEMEIAVLGKNESTEERDLEITAHVAGGGARRSARFIVFSEYVSRFECSTTQHKDTDAVCTLCDVQTGVTCLHRHDPDDNRLTPPSPCDHRTITDTVQGKPEDCKHCLHYCMRCCASVLYGGKQDDYRQPRGSTVQENHEVDLSDGLMIAYLRAKGHNLKPLRTQGLDYGKVYMTIMTQQKLIGLRVKEKHSFIVHGCRLNDSDGKITKPQMFCWDSLVARSSWREELCEYLYPETDK